MKINNKKILVTGGGSGIGREIVLALLQRGANVVAVDMREESLADLQKVAGSKNLTTVALDISDQAAVAALPKKVGEIDGIINNAGIIQPFVKINDLDNEAINRVMNVNFYGLLNMTKAFLPGLLNRPEGYVVNVSSMGGFLPVPGQGLYGASKAAVKLLTESLFAELLDTNVHVSVVFPGAVATNITQNSGVKIALPKGKSQKEYKATPAPLAAKIILDGMEKNKPQIFVGGDSKFMNTIYRLNPVFATKFIAKQMKSLLETSTPAPEKEKITVKN